MLLKKALLSMFLFCPLVTWGQLLSVTATLTDSDTVVWINGNCSVELFSPNGQAFYNGTAVPTGPQTCAINGSGVLTTSIYNTSTITPTGAMYRFSIGSATSAPASQFLTPVTAANQTSNLSALITAPRFNSAIAFVYGYADVEALHGAPGNQYFKTTATAGQRIWSGSAWTSGGGGGSSGISGLVLNCIPKAATATTITGCSSVTDDGTVVYTTEAYSSNTSIGAINGKMQMIANSIGGGYDMLIFDGSLPSTNGVGQRIISGGASDANMYFDTAVDNTSLYKFRVPIGGVEAEALTIGLTATTSSAGVYPSLDPAITVGQSVCVKAAGPPLVLGKCTSVVGAGGACTCS